ncbi:hypothetical protein EON83_24460 [bacterium]|nr:MAG: hypothetical protein EON83_24460 [bacterium]
MVKSILLALALLTCAVSCNAQQTPPQIRIVDVIPSADPSIEPQTPLVALDFLIGAWPRPSWWGRPWNSRHLDEGFMPSPGDFKGRITAKSGNNVSAFDYLYCTSYAPRWNEALGLYTVHVRAAYKAKTWPKNAKLNFQGELPAPFGATFSGSALPFEVEWEELPKKGFADAQLVSPSASLWVKWARVFKRPLGNGNNYGYEADVMLAGRRAKKRASTVSLPQFIDGEGKPVVLSNGGGYGNVGGFSDPDSNIGNFEFVESPLEFTQWRTAWNEGVTTAAGNQFLKLLIEYGGRERLQLTFPTVRDGILLEGEISPNDLKIESPAPSSN